MGLRCFAATLVLMGAASLSLFAAEATQPANPNDGWKLIKEGGGISLYSRARAGTAFKEFKALGEIEASTRAVHNVLDDLENYSSFMPYTVECRLIKREGDSMYSYQRLSPKIVCDRDYTLRVRETSWPVQGGMVYLSEWQPANEFGPGEKPGVLRVKLDEGSWLLEPSGADKTRATYLIYTDSGGKLPAFVANFASQIGISKLFAAIRKQAKEAKYQAK
jgi:Polyketide cyclase / dehydrase and lipid transport